MTTTNPKVRAALEAARARREAIRAEYEARRALDRAIRAGAEATRDLTPEEWDEYERLTKKEGR
jgi:hypothetical protein